MKGADDALLSTLNKRMFRLGFRGKMFKRKGFDNLLNQAVGVGKKIEIGLVVGVIGKSIWMEKLADKGGLVQGMIVITDKSGDLGKRIMSGEGFRVIPWVDEVEFELGVVGYYGGDKSKARKRRGGA